MSQVFETADADAAEQILRDAYGGNIRIDGGGHPVRIRLEAGSLTPSLRLDHIQFAMNFGLTANPLGLLVICHVRSGRVAYRSGGSERAYGPGDVFFPVQPDRPYIARCAGTDFDTAVIDPALPSQVADGEPGRTQQPVRFTSHEPVSARAAQAWRDTYAYVSDSLLAAPDTAGYPLLAASAARLLVATALATFPNNALTDPTSTDRHDGHPDTVRRAVAFIDENAHTDITIADIAAAAFVTIRAVQFAFRRHLDTTPMAYLRRVRLDHAHRELLAADPARHTVSATAYRWGFSSVSRFTAAYRQAYGVPPGDTLRQG